MNKGQDRIKYELSEDLKHALKNLRFDDALPIIENHIAELIGQGKEDDPFISRLMRLRGAIWQYKENRLEEIKNRRRAGHENKF